MSSDAGFHNEETPTSAKILFVQANELRDEGNFEEARPLYERALQIQEKTLGEHADTAMTLLHFGLWYSDQGFYQEAQHLFARAVYIFGNVGEPYYAVASLQNLGSALVDQGLLEDARYCYEQALWINEKYLGKESSFAKQIRERLAGLDT